MTPHDLAEAMHDVYETAFGPAHADRAMSAAVTWVVRGRWWRVWT